MKIFRQPFFFLLLVLLLNLLQSICSELAHDEAYYWVYSQHLAWGYFDHPPAIALLIKVGYTLFKNEVGVRLFSILAHVLTLYILYRITQPKDVPLFFVLLLSAVISHVGFMAVPDIPLVLSVALFFFFYKRYLMSYDWKNALFLGISIAAMGWSKYHGIVVLTAVLLSDLKLLRKKTFYLSIAVATILMSPHFYWQYMHDFPTFRFHLFDRSAEPYTFAYVGEYILGQLLIFGPFVGFILFGATAKYKTKTPFERSMKYTAYGVIGFFLLSSFKGRVEPNWTVPALIPLIYLTYRYVTSVPHLRKWIYRLALPSFVIALFFRLILIVEILPPRLFPLASEFHGWKAWASEIENNITRRPALFFNNYQRAAKYDFYSNGKGFSLSTSSYAGSQYDLLTQEQEALQGQKVALMHLLPHEEGKKLIGAKDHIYIEPLDSFYFYNRLRINLTKAPQKMLPSASEVIYFEICNPTQSTIHLHGNKKQRLQVGYQLFRLKKHISESKKRKEIPTEQILSGQCIPMHLPILAPAEAGTYRYRISIFNGVYHERNGNFQKLVVR